MTKKKPEPATDLPTWVYRGAMTLAATIIITGGGYFLSSILNGQDKLEDRTGSIERKVDKTEVKVDLISTEHAKRLDDLTREVRRLQR